MATEDGIILSAISLEMAKRSEYVWNYVVTTDNTAVSEFASRRPTGPMPVLGMMAQNLHLNVPNPPNPAFPSVPQTSSSTNPKIELESTTAAFVKGLFGGLKTGAKAVVNSTVDTVASTVTLGQYDPPDVWKVDPATDLYYNQARAFADIATNAAAAAATGGLAGAAGRVGQVARVADKMDTVGNVINGVKGAVDISKNGLSLQNGAQVVVGAIGGAQVANQIRQVADATTTAGKFTSATAPVSEVETTFRRASSSAMATAASRPTTIKTVRELLGKSGLVDFSKVTLQFGGGGAMGWVQSIGKKAVTDMKGRAIINITENALKSLKETVITIGHELHHLREIPAGPSRDEFLAELAGEELWEKFSHYLSHNM